MEDIKVERVKHEEIQFNKKIVHALFANSTRFVHSLQKLCVHARVNLAETQIKELMRIA